MRMWMLPPSLLCRDHLLGEHGEIHKHRHNFVKQHNMSGRTIAPAQIEPAAMQDRHDEIVLEMVRRGYNHKSPYEQPDISYLLIEAQNAKVDMDYNYKDLAGRCAECKKRIIIERQEKTK